MGYRGQRSAAVSAVRLNGCFGRVHSALRFALTFAAHLGLSAAGGSSTPLKGKAYSEYSDRAALAGGCCRCNAKRAAMVQSRIKALEKMTVRTAVARRAAAVSGNGAASGCT